MRKNEVYLLKVKSFKETLLVKVRNVFQEAVIVDSINLEGCIEMDTLSLFYNTQERVVELRPIEADTWDKAKKLMTFYQNGVKSLLTNIKQT